MIVKLSDGRGARIAKRWEEPRRFDGRAHVGAYTGEEFRHADIGRTASGAWVILPDSQWQGERPEPYEVEPAEAAGWFAACGLELPAELEEVLA